VVLVLASDPSGSSAGGPSSQGGIFIAVATKGSPQLHHVIELIQAQRRVEAQETLAEWVIPFEFLDIADDTTKMVLGALNKFAQTVREQTGENDLAETFAAVPAFGEIRYGTRTLASGLFVYPPVTVSSMLLPYNGGRLNLEVFKLVEFIKNEGSPQLEALVVIFEPTLSVLEKQILGLMSRRMLK
jgi:hypothetical protein